MGHSPTLDPVWAGGSRSGADLQNVCGLCCLKLHTDLHVSFNLKTERFYREQVGGFQRRGAGKIGEWSQKYKLAVIE